MHYPSRILYPPYSVLTVSGPGGGRHQPGTRSLRAFQSPSRQCQPTHDPALRPQRHDNACPARYYHQDFGDDLTVILSIRGVRACAPEHRPLALCCMVRRTAPLGRGARRTRRAPPEVRRPGCRRGLLRPPKNPRLCSSMASGSIKFCSPSVDCENEHRGQTKECVGHWLFADDVSY